ncbi:MAG: DUF6132 family protein [Elusimicrobiota bacterium]|nr:DUF6132 family protein [Endomicrobiia bacterium]MDW8055920.1 DUF6132 family protein [Elusimicrobiota bacterium]
MEQFLKTLLYAIIGGGIGYIVGFLSRKAGGSCPLTCTPWGSIITGAIFGILISFNKK